MTGDDARRAKSHPTYRTMIQQAVEVLSEKKGSSRQKINKYIMCNYFMSSETKRVTTYVSNTIRKMVEEGMLIRTKGGQGASGTFKLNKNSGEPSKGKDATALKKTSKTRVRKAAVKKVVMSSRKLSKNGKTPMSAVKTIAKRKIFGVDNVSIPHLSISLDVPDEATKMKTTKGKAKKRISSKKEVDSNSNEASMSAELEGVAKKKSKAKTSKRNKSNKIASQLENDESDALNETYVLNETSESYSAGSIDEDEESLDSSMDQPQERKKKSRATSKKPQKVTESRRKPQKVTEKTKTTTRKPRAKKKATTP